MIPKKLSDEEIKKLQDLEKELGVILVAYWSYADFSEKDIVKLKRLEQDIESTILAFKT